jgi:hypothetical protein
VNSKSLLPAATVLAPGLFVLSGQQPAALAVFNLAVFNKDQAEAGRKAYANTCGRCRTPRLLGRKGDPGELPPVSSLPEEDEQVNGAKAGTPGADQYRGGHRSRVNRRAGAAMNGFRYLSVHQTVHQMEVL